MKIFLSETTTPIATKPNVDWSLHGPLQKQKPESAPNNQDVVTTEIIFTYYLMGNALEILLKNYWLIATKLYWNGHLLILYQNCFGIPNTLTIVFFS